MILLCSLAVAKSAMAAKVQIIFDDWEGPPVRVFLSRPAGLKPERPMVFLMHGAGRNAEDDRDRWHDLALEHDVLLVVPEFNEAAIASSPGYKLGNVANENGDLENRDLWSFSAIELIFDDIRNRFEMSTETYFLYGHSTGAQFVHRYLYFVPEANLAGVVLANADWYTMPDFETEFPYGLKNSGVSRAQLAAVLQLPVTIMLGDQDSDPEHTSLRDTPEALLQGENYMLRGVAFFEAARAMASELNLPYAWNLSMVKNADDKDQKMASAAMELLLKDVVSADD